MGFMNILKKGIELAKGGAKKNAKQVASMMKEFFMKIIKKFAIKYLLKGVLILSIIISIVVLVEQAPKMIFNAGKNALVSWVKGVFGIDDDEEVEFIPGAIVLLDGDRYKFMENEDGESVLKTFEDDANKLLNSEYIKKYAKIHVYTTYPDIGNSKYEGGMKVKRGEKELKYQEGATTETLGADNFTVIQGSKEEQYVKKLVWKEENPVMTDEEDEDGNKIQKKDENGNLIYEYVPHVQEIDSTSNAYSASIYFLMHLAQSTSTIEKTNVKFMDEVLEMLDDDFDYNFSVSSTLLFTGSNWVNNLRDILKKEEYEEIKDSLVEKGDSFLETIANSNELKGLYSKMLSMLRSLGYTGKYAKTYANGNGDFRPVGPPSVTKEQFKQAIIEYNSGNQIQIFIDNADNMYDWALEIGVNPEYMITKAIAESGLSWDVEGNYNFWGWDSPNGSSRKFEPDLEAVYRAFGQQVVRYCTEGTDAYRGCELRAQWLETGVPTEGCNNPVDFDVYEGFKCEIGTLEWVLCKYTWVGEHEPGDSSAGGKYALKLSMTAEEYQEHCGYGTASPRKGHTPGAYPTAYEQAKYVEWNAKGQREKWTKVFGKFVTTENFQSTLGTSAEHDAELTALNQIYRPGDPRTYASLSKDHYITPSDASEVPEQSEQGDNSSFAVASKYGSTIGRAGYNSYATIDGRTFRLYRQDRGSYVTQHCYLGDVFHHGCSLIAASIVISGYLSEAEYNNNTIAQVTSSFAGGSFESIQGLLISKIGAEVGSDGIIDDRSTNYLDVNRLTSALKNYVVIVHVYQGPFSTGKHFIVLLGEKNGKIYVANPAGKNRGWIDASRVVSFMQRQDDGRALLIKK